MTNGLVTGLAVTANKGVVLDTNGRESELFLCSTIGTNGIGRLSGQLFHQLFCRCGRHSFVYLLFFIRASCEYGYRIGLIDRFSVHWLFVWSEFPNLTSESQIGIRTLVTCLLKKRLSTGTKMPGLFYDDPNCDPAITRK